MKKPSVQIPFVKFRNGRPRFEPSPKLRKQGHKGHDLRHADGTWLTAGEALDWSREFQAKLTMRVARTRKAPVARPARAFYSVADLFRDWLSSPEVLSKRANTIRDYRQKVRVLEDYHLAVQDPDIADAKGIVISREARAIAAIWSAEAAAISRPICFNLYEALFRHRGNHTANAVLVIFGVAIEYAQRKGNMPEALNPAHRIKKILPKVSVRCGQVDEIAALVAAADQLGRPEVGDMVLLGVWSGQRQGDRLQMQLVNLKDGRIECRQSKTDALVSIPAAPLLKARLEASFARRKAAERIHPHVVLDEAQWQPFKADHYRHVYAQVRAEAIKSCPSVARLRDKDMRATAVGWLAMAGCSNTEIASITGHTLKTVNDILKHYWAANAVQADNAIEKLTLWFDKQQEKEMEE